MYWQNNDLTLKAVLYRSHLNNQLWILNIWNSMMASFEGQLTHVEEFVSLGSAAFVTSVLRVIDFLYSSSIWCSYWTLLLLLDKLLQGKTWLDLGYILYKEGGQTLEHGAMRNLSVWRSNTHLYEVQSNWVYVGTALRGVWMVSRGPLKRLARFCAFFFP